MQEKQLENIDNPPSYYPLFCNLQGKRVLVVGGGRVACRKVEALLPSGASVVVVSPEVVPELEQMAAEGDIQWEKRSFQPDDCQDVWLIIAATDDEDVQKIVFSQAEKRRIFCNVVDEPKRCSFIVPSQVRRGDLVLAISTAGQSPAVAKALRKRLEREFPGSWGRFVSLCGELRRLILAGTGDDLPDRCAALADFRVVDWIEAGDLDMVRQWAEELAGPEGRKAADRVLEQNSKR